MVETKAVERSGDRIENIRAQYIPQPQGTTLNAVTSTVDSRHQRLWWGADLHLFLPASEGLRQNLLLLWVAATQDSSMWNEPTRVQFSHPLPESTLLWTTIYLMQSPGQSSTHSKTTYFSSAEQAPFFYAAFIHNRWNVPYSHLCKRAEIRDFRCRFESTYSSFELNLWTTNLYQAPGQPRKWRSIHPAPAPRPVLTPFIHTMPGEWGEVKWPCWEADHSPSSTADIESDGAPHIIMAQCLINKHRDNFTVTLPYHTFFGAAYM
jgi:hypothetical protein